MKVERIDNYTDNRFSKEVLYQHGCFLVDGIDPYEVEIVSDYEAIVRGKDSNYYEAIIEEFRFYTPHITTFYDSFKNVIKCYPKKEIFEINLEDIQPSQFYVDQEKIDAIKTFLNKEEDIIIQVMQKDDRYISLDGHTRLYYAVMKKFKKVRAVLANSDDYISYFVEEAMKRNITTPYDLILVSHEEYKEKWHKFCDSYFDTLDKE